MGVMILMKKCLKKNFCGNSLQEKVLTIKTIIKKVGWYLCLTKGEMGITQTTAMNNKGKIVQKHIKNIITTLSHTLSY